MGHPLALYAWKFASFEKLEVAPPPVDKCVTFSATPAALTAATVSPPAITLVTRG
jgi:hypothetical protein